MSFSFSLALNSLFFSSQVVLCYRSLSATFPWKQPVWQELACCKSVPVMLTMENYLPSAETLSSLMCRCKLVRGVSWAAESRCFGGKEQGWSRRLSAGVDTEGCWGHPPSHTKANTRHAEDVPSVPYLSTRVCVAVPLMPSLLRTVTLLAGDMGGCVIRLCSVCNDLAWSCSLSGQADSHC